MKTLKTVVAVAAFAIPWRPSVHYAYVAVASAFTLAGLLALPSTADRVALAGAVAEEDRDARLAYLSFDAPSLSLAANLPKEEIHSRRRFRKVSLPPW